MSLVVGWLMENFVAMAGDGKAVVKDERGKVSLVGEDAAKFHLFTPDLIIAAAGDNGFFDVLVQSLEPLVEQSRGDEQLFEYLTTAIPLAALTNPQRRSPLDGLRRHAKTFPVFALDDKREFRRA